MSDEYTNETLADDYLRVVIQRAHESQAHWFKAQRRRIAEAPVDIAAFFKEHDGLGDLQVKGIGPRTRGALELVLERGMKEARRTIGERQDFQLQRSQFKGLKPRKGGDLYVNPVYRSEK